MLSRFDGIIQLHVRHHMHLHINTHIPRDKSPSSSASLTAKRACNSGNITREIERFAFTGDLKEREKDNSIIIRESEKERSIYYIFATTDKNKPNEMLERKKRVLT